MQDETQVWVSKRTNKGKTAYRVRWVDPASGRWCTKHVGTDSKVAEREAARLEDELSRGAYRDIRRIRWTEFVEDHVDKIEGTRNATEAKRTLEEFGNMMQPIGPKDINYPMIEAYVVKLSAAGNKSATINKKLRYAGSVEPCYQTRVRWAEPDGRRIVQGC